jgi:hypothetical protein
VFGFPYMMMPAERRQHRFTLFFFTAALVALVPYFVQGKNFWYHLVPALAFYYCALALMAQSLLNPLLPRLPAALRVAQPFIFTIALLAGAYAFMPVNTQFPTHAEMRALPLTQRVAQCAAPCSFFMFNNNIGIIHPTAIYAGRDHASRFPGLWFLPGVLALDATQARNYEREKYATMMAADLAQYKPRELFIGRFALDKTTPQVMFNPGAYLGTDPTFSEEWLRYRKTGENITTTNADYYRGTALESDTPIIFDIYERIADTPSQK